MSRSPEEITTALAAPFPQSAIKYREDRGTRLAYVEGHTVFRRLIEATGNGFDVAVLDQGMQPFGTTKSGADRLLLTARVRLTIPGMGSREHMGVQIVMSNGGEDMWKGAITDAIKKAATLFGVGLDLYGPDYEAGELDNQPVSQRPVLQRGRDGVSISPADGIRFRNDSSVTEKQIRMIGQQVKEQGLDVPTVCHWVGGDSIGTLSKQQASRAIDILTGTTERPTSAPRPAPDAPQRPSAAPRRAEPLVEASEDPSHAERPLTDRQLAMLHALAGEIGQARGWDRRWASEPLHAAFGVASSKGLRREQASQAIDGLQAMRSDDSLTFAEALELRHPGTLPDMPVAEGVPQTAGVAGADRWTS